MDIAVVIPTYDRPSLLRETLDSVFAQSMQPREVIVVDNGHGDETAAMLAEEYAGRVTALRMAPQGVEAARNLGMSSTTATWVALLDDDDLWQPRYLETVARAVEDERANVVYSDHRKFSVTPQGERYYTRQTNAQLAPNGYWDDVPRPDEGVNWSYVGSFPVERLLRYNGFYASTTVVKRDLLDRIGLFDSALRGSPIEDIEFLARALTHGRLAMIWEPLMLYRVHAANTLGANLMAIRVGRWEVFEYLHAGDAAGNAQFAAALERNLPQLRANVFDLAFRYQETDLLRRIMPLLRSQDWTPKRRPKRFVLRLPAGPRRWAVQALVGGGVERDLEALRGAYPQAPAELPNPE